MYTCMLHRLCIYIHIIMCIYIYTNCIHIYVLNTIYIYHISLWKLPLPLQPLSDPCHVKPRFTSSAISAMGVEALGENRQDPRKNNVWLVVYLPLWKLWKSVGINSPNIWKNKIHVPNHQPGDSMHASMKSEIGELFPTNLIPLLWKIPPPCLDLKSWLEE